MDHGEIGPVKFICNQRRAEGRFGSAHKHFGTGGGLA